MGHLHKGVNVRTHTHTQTHAHAHITLRFHIDTLGEILKVPISGSQLDVMSLRAPILKPDLFSRKQVERPPKKDAPPPPPRVLDV